MKHVLHVEYDDEFHTTAIKDTTETHVILWGILEYVRAVSTAHFMHVGLPPQQHGAIPGPDGQP